MLGRYIREVLEAPCYRGHPIAALELGYAKWLFARARASDIDELFRALDIDPVKALQGFARWETLLAPIVSSIRASMEDGALLYGVVRALRPAHVVETGIDAGISTSFICAALIENGTGELHSIDQPPGFSADHVHQDGARYWWPDGTVAWAMPEVIRSAIRGRHHVDLRGTRAALPDLLGKLPVLDIFFHDDLHTPDHMLWEYETVWPRLRQDGLLISDDSNFGWVKFVRKMGLERRALLNIQRLTAIRKR